MDDAKNTKNAALEKHYREISSLYDMAEELASTVESEFTKDPEAQLALVEPLISQVADSADVLAEEFINILEKPSLVKSAKGRVEGALRKLFMAFEDYRNKVNGRGQKTLSGLANIADPVVTKVRRQAERIILIFMSLMEISLDRIMHKSELDEFKRNNERAMKIMPPPPSVGH